MRNRPPTPGLEILRWFRLDSASPRVAALGLANFSIGVDGEGAAWVFHEGLREGPYDSIGALLASRQLVPADLLPGKSTDERQFGVRLPLDLWEAIEHERRRRQATRPGAQVTTSDAIRELLWRALRDNEKPK
jgi:hypothetical protein